MDHQPANIRRATPADAETIAAFNLALAQESENRRLRPEVVAHGVTRMLADPAHGEYFLAERDGKVVGQVLITREFSDWRNGEFWWIQSVYVIPEARRQGVYRALHGHVEQQARQAGGVCGLRLYVDRGNARAQDVYQQMGMKATDYDVYEADWTALEGGSVARPTDIDLYCLSCGYNLRGLPGDPIRCPECGNLNPVGDVELPAPMIAAQLRRMETAPAICVGSAIAGLSILVLLVALFVVGGASLGSDAMCALVLPALLSLGAWMAGSARFRRSCLGKAGWDRVLTRYHLVGVPAGLVILFVITSPLWVFGVGGRAIRWPMLAVAVIAFALSLVGILLGMVRPYARLRRDLDLLQREVAITIAREESRRRLARDHRW